jgi:hypothetical protein
MEHDVMAAMSGRRCNLFAGLALAIFASLAGGGAWGQAGPSGVNTLSPGRGEVQPAKPMIPDNEFANATDHYEALKRHAKPRAPGARAPDWTGIWIQSGGLGYGSPSPAPLTPDFRARYDKLQADLKRGIEYDRLTTCLPAGHPRWVSEPYNKEFVILPDRVLLLQEFMNETRRVYTDGRPHTPRDELFPTWLGDSIGFWDGDTLVISTIGLKAGEYQRNEPEYSDHVETIEQWRKTDADTIEIQMTVYDPLSLTKPWHVAKLYKRSHVPDQRIRYWECEGTSNAVRTADGGTTHILPGEPGYKDPDKPVTASAVTSAGQ